MSSARKRYTTEIHENFGYLATWLPGTRLKPGDIGVVRDRTFFRFTDISRMGIDIPVLSSPAKSDLRYATENGVSITFKASGTAQIPNSILGPNEAGIVVEFKKKNATVFEALGCQARSLGDQVALRQMVLEKMAGNEWDRDWRVVTEVVQATSATILISSAADARVELKAAGDLSAATNSLAEVSSQFAVGISRNIDTQIVATQGLTPLFRVAGIVTHWFGTPTWDAEAHGTSFETGTPADVRAAFRGHDQFRELAYRDL